MTLTQFEVFLAVIQHKSFTRAAEMLNMTQSAVSQTIQALETELGVTLVHRNRSGVTATHIGERMRTHAQEVLFHTRSMVEEASASKGLDIGTIRIGTIPSVSVKLLPTIIGEFHKRFPNVELVLFEGNESEVLEWIEGSVVDMGFLPASSDFEIEFRPLASDALRAVVSANHPLADKSTVTLKDLCEFPLVATKAEKSGWMRNLFRVTGLQPNILFEVGDTSSLLTLVEENVGVTMLYDLGIPRVCADVAIRPISPAICRNIGVGVRSLHRVTPAAAEFILQAERYAKAVKTGDN